MALNIPLLKKSFDAVKTVAQDFADKFYDDLFLKYPQSKGLFEKVDLEKQKGHLLNSLVYIVDNVEDTETLVPYLKNMGKRHLKYGTQKEHYAWVGETLIGVFQYFFDNNWTQELENTWLEAYTIISNVMIEGMEEEVGSQQKSSQQQPSKSDHNQGPKNHNPMYKMTNRIEKLSQEILYKAMQVHADEVASKVISEMKDRTIVKAMREEIKKNVGPLVSEIMQQCLQETIEKEAQKIISQFNTSSNKDKAA